MPSLQSRINLALELEKTSRFKAVRRLPRAGANISSTPGFPLRLLFQVFVLFCFAVFTVQLAMNSTGRFVGSPVLQPMTISTELFVFAFVLLSRNVRKASAQISRQICLNGASITATSINFSNSATYLLYSHTAGRHLLSLHSMQPASFTTVKFGFIGLTSQLNQS